MGQGQGGGPKRTELEREEDLAKIARLDRMGYNSTDIAKQIGVSRQQIDADKKLLYERYRESQLVETSHRIDKLEQQYNDVLREAWLAYQQSKQEAKKTVEKMAPHPIKDKDGNPTGESVTELVEIATTTEGRLPGAQYLMTIERVLEAKRAMYGLDAPKRVEMKRLTIDLEQLMAEVNKGGTPNVQQVEDQLAQLLGEVPRLPPAQPAPHLSQTNGNDGTLPNGLHET